MTSPNPSRKILLVEDDMDLGQATVDLLTQRGHDVQWAISANDAYQKISKHAFDIALLDLGLGLDDGVKLFDALRRHGRAVPPVIILSAQPIDMLREAAVRTGAVRILQKPCSGADIDTAIAKALEQAADAPSPD